MKDFLKNIYKKDLKIFRTFLKKDFFPKKSEKMLHLYVRLGIPYFICLSSMYYAQTVKNLPAMWEIWVWFLDWEDPLEEDMATSILGNSNILAWRIPMDRGTWWARGHGVAQSQTRLKRLGGQQVNKYRTGLYFSYVFILSHSRLGRLQPLDWDLFATQDHEGNEVYLEWPLSFAV